MPQDDGWSESSGQIAVSFFVWRQFICSLQQRKVTLMSTCAVCQGYIYFHVLKSTDYACSGSICVWELARVRTDSFFLKNSVKDMRYWLPLSLFSLVGQELFLCGPGWGLGYLANKGKNDCAAPSQPSESCPGLMEGLCSSQSSPSLWAHWGRP